MKQVFSNIVFFLKELITYGEYSNIQKRFRILSPKVGLKVELELTIIFSLAIILGIFVNFLFGFKYFAKDYFITNLSYLFLLVLLLLSIMPILKGIEKIKTLKQNAFLEQNPENNKILKYFFVPVFVFLLMTYSVQLIYNNIDNNIVNFTFDYTKELFLSNNFICGLFLIFITELVILIPIIRLSFLPKYNLDLSSNSIV